MQGLLCSNTALRLPAAVARASLVRAASSSARGSPSTSPKTSTSQTDETKAAGARARRLQSFATSAEADLLTGLAGPTGASALSPSGQSQHSHHSKGVSNNRAVLRANKFAGNYTMDRAELSETLKTKPARQARTGSAGTTRAPRELAGAGQHKTTRPSDSSGRRTVQSTARGDRSDAHKRVLFQSPDEGVLTVGPGYLEYRGPAPVGDRHLFTDGVRSVITYARLRDACPGPESIHPTTRQKVHTSGEAALAVAQLGNEVVDASVMHMATNPDGVLGVEVHWPAGPAGSAGGGKPHNSFYPLSLIRRLSSNRVRGMTYLYNTLKRKLWDESQLMANDSNLRIPYVELNANSAEPNKPLEARPDVLLRVLEQLQVYGLVILTGVPTDKTGNKECSLRMVAEQVGLLRNTFYGETWDVKSVANSKNVAYTNLNLGLHMDLLYFALPPRFQLLHCLRNRVIGGQSYFVDSFKAAVNFQRKQPELYKSLQRNRLEYEYDNDGHYLQYRHAVVPPQASLNSSSLHAAINWSPPFQAPPTRGAKDASLSVPSDPVAAARADTEFYNALAEFQAELDRPEYEYEFLMQEGDLVLFDNQRVLHARRQFRDKTSEEIKRDGTVLVDGEPSRWLKGGYFDGSTVWDKVAALNDEVRGGPRE